jgi:hypothetical protein
MKRPTTAGSPPKWRCHIPWLSTSTRGAFGRSSSSVTARPRSGRTPSSGKNSAETSCAFSRAGSPTPVIVTVSVSQAARARSARLSRCQSSQFAGETTLRGVFIAGKDS